MITGVIAAAALAQELGLPLVESAAAAAAAGLRYALIPGPRGLALEALGQSGQRPIYVDFVEGAARHRRLYGRNSGSLLARAAGIKGRAGRLVLDAAAGLGRDGFVLASLGCRVLMCERSPAVWALLRDGLRRALDAPETAEIGARIELRCEDARGLIRELAQPQAARPAVIYLDPMFPAHSGSALVKKELRACREIVGPDQDAGELLEIALAAGVPRVVVKRMRRDEWLGGRKPDQSLAGKANRFDLYFRTRLEA